MDVFGMLVPRSFLHRISRFQQTWVALHIMRVWTVLCTGGITLFDGVKLITKPLFPLYSTAIKVRTTQSGWTALQWFTYIAESIGCSTISQSIWYVFSRGYPKLGCRSVFHSPDPAGDLPQERLSNERNNILGNTIFEFKK